jgi:hypothetical protein
MTLPLDTVADVKRELAEVYASCKVGNVTPAKAAQLAGVLREVRACLEVTEVEQKIAAMWAAIHDGTVVPLKRVPS